MLTYPELNATRDQQRWSDREAINRYWAAKAHIAKIARYLKAEGAASASVSLPHYGGGTVYANGTHTFKLD